MVVIKLLLKHSEHFFVPLIGDNYKFAFGLQQTMVLRYDSYQSLAPGHSDVSSECIEH